MKDEARALKSAPILFGLIALAACVQAAAQPLQAPGQVTATTRLEILGDYAGRKLKLTVDGRVEWDGYGHLNPPGMSWFITVEPGQAPVPVELQIEPCTEPFKATFPRDGETRALIIQGCDVKLPG